MNILIIGGSRFVGREIVASAMGRGLEVTVFNRAKTGTAPQGVEQLVGDRVSDLGVLAGRKWDAVIDTCGYLPRIVGLSARALAESTDRYVFVSTISVYPPDQAPGGTEEAKLLPEPPEEVEEVTGESYGGLKVACERVVREVFGDRSLFIRPGLVVGPGDYTERFTWWAAQFASEGPLPVPDKKAAPVQVVDARDLGNFTVHASMHGLSGAYHVCGPHPAHTFEEFVTIGSEAFGHVCTPVWVSPQAFSSAGIRPWSELPLVSSFDDSVDGLFCLDNTKAVAAGLVQRPVLETIQDTAEWWKSLGQPAFTKVGPTRERLDDVLAAKKKAPTS